MTDTIWLTIGATIILVALTLCFCIAAVCIRMLREDPSEPSLVRHHAGVTAGSIALFGILVTGVFVITVFRIDVGVTSTIERSIAEEVSLYFVPYLANLQEEVEDQIGEIRDEAGRLESRAFGSWEPISTFDEVRQAESSGFIVASINVTGNAENFSTPILFHVGESDEALNEAAWLFRSRDNALVPVGAGEYWMITGSERTFGDAEIHWVPMFQPEPNAGPAD